MKIDSETAFLEIQNLLVLRKTSRRTQIITESHCNPTSQALPQTPDKTNLKKQKFFNKILHRFTIYDFKTSTPEVFIFQNTQITKFAEDFFFCYF